MKMQKILVLFSLLLLFVLVAGCGQSPTSMATSHPVATTLPVNNLSPTKTTLPTITPSTTNTIIPLPTLAPDLTSTTIPLPTATIVPTLITEEARKRLLELLMTNGDCRLPCIWGITPGKSSYLEGQSILMPLKGIADTTGTGFGVSSTDNISHLYIEVDSISPLYIEGNMRLNTLLAYVYGTDGIVSSISFGALEEEVTYDAKGNWTTKRPIYDSTTFGKRVAYYSLAHFLTEQGIPASIMIQFSGMQFSPVVAGGLDIALLYPSQGIWVNYEMTMQNRGNTKMGCPNGNAQVDMELFPLGTPSSFYAQLDQTNWGITKGGYKPLEEVTTMSVEKFYEIFRNPTSNQCIQAPANLWPTPEIDSPNQ